VNGSVVDTDGDCPVVLARLRVSVPDEGPVVTGVFQVTPPFKVVGVPIEAPVAAVPEREKLLAVTPVTAELNVSAQFTVLALVGLELTRFSEVTVGVGMLASTAAFMSIRPYPTE
jgi:hypothetical protein